MRDESGKLIKVDDMVCFTGPDGKPVVMLVVHIQGPTLTCVVCKTGRHMTCLAKETKIFNKRD